MAEQIGSLPQFELQRRRARQRATQLGQESVGAVQRRLAALGGLSGGAGIKLQEKARTEAQRLGSEAIEGIDIQEAAAQQRLKEIQEAREFQAEQAKLGREFARGERLGGQEFAAQQAGIGREFAAEQAGIGREFAAQQSELQRGFVAQESALERAQRKDLALKQLDQAQQKLNLDRDIANFNKEIARWQQGQPTDMFGQLLGPQFSTQRLFGGGSSPLGTLGGLALGGPIGGVIGGSVGRTIGRVFCHLADSLVVMADGTEKPIKEIKLGDKLFGNIMVTHIGQSYVMDDIYEYEGELVTGAHVVYENGKLIQVENSKLSKLTKVDEVSTVYPMDTDTGYYVTSSGVVSIGDPRIEGALTPEHELELFNKEKDYLKEIKDLEHLFYINKESKNTEILYKECA